MTAYIKGSIDEMQKYLKLLKTYNTTISKEIESINEILENFRIKKIDARFPSHLEAREEMFRLMEQYAQSQKTTIESLLKLIQEGK